MKFSLFTTAALAGLSSLVSGVFAAPAVNARTDVVASGSSVSIGGSISLVGLVSDIKVHVTTSAEKLQALDLKAENATAVATEVTTDLTNLLNAYVERFKVNKTISLVGVISADLVNDVLAIFHALVSIVAILYSPVLGLLHLVASLLKVVALIVFLLGDVLAAVLPLLAYILIPAFHLVGAIVILVADVLSPIDGVSDLGALAYLASQVAA